MVVGLLNQIVPTEGHGPLWKFFMDIRAEGFSSTWGYYLGGVHNFMNPQYISNPQHWYSGVDFQLYCLTVYFVMKLERTGRQSALIALALGAMVLTYVQTELMDLPAGLLYFVPLVPFRSASKIWKIYYTPHAHFPSYVLGILTGFHYSRHGAWRPGKSLQAVLWLASVLGMSFALFGSKMWVPNNIPSTATTALFAATHRFLFSLGVSWLIFACLTGRGGFITSVLSWKMWQPFSKLSFSAYLIHDFIVYFQWLSLRSRISGKSFHMASMVAGNWIFSFVAAWFFHATIEKPIALVVSCIERRMVEQTGRSQEEESDRQHRDKRNKNI
ncbi:O-acyltransferase like protein-like [Ornithodoros turicata]|uniref:O-acyltransferase like protein-like n=1 Tax=Ornithodoros turicata TaxID=34597 RepID=UPI0031397DE3